MCKQLSKDTMDSIPLKVVIVKAGKDKQPQDCYRGYFLVKRKKNCFKLATEFREATNKMDIDLHSRKKFSRSWPR